MSIESTTFEILSGDDAEDCVRLLGLADTLEKSKTEAREMLLGDPKIPEASGLLRYTTREHLLLIGFTVARDDATAYRVLRFGSGSQMMNTFVGALLQAWYDMGMKEQGPDSEIEMDIPTPL